MLLTWDCSGLHRSASSCFFSPSCDPSCPPADLPVYYPALFGCKLPNDAMILVQGFASAADAGLELPLPGAAT